MEITEAVARKVIETVDAGLVNGLGKAKPGSMCVEAAVCFALGLPHGDNPPCVGRAVRAFKICLNDSQWSSDAARAKGMRLLAVAQLGSDKIDQRRFAKEVVVGTVKKILPIALRAAAKALPAHAEALEVCAVACEAAIDFAAARSAAQKSREVTKTVRADATYAAADAAYAAAAAAYAAADAAAAYAAYAADADADADAAAAAAAYAADAAADAAAAYAADAAAAAAAYAAAAYAADAAAAAAAYAAAYAAAAAKAKRRDSILAIAAEIGLDALKACGAEGVKWLPLCEAGYRAAYSNRRNPDAA
jgi:hypothetical protein